MISCSSDCTFQVEDAIFTAARENDVDALEDVLFNNATNLGGLRSILNAGRETPLHIASKNGNAVIVDTLLSLGFSACAIDNSENRPIDVICSDGCEDTEMGNMTRNLLEFAEEHDPVSCM